MSAYGIRSPAIGAAFTRIARIAPSRTATRCTKRPRGNLIPIRSGRGFGFWHAWHGFLRRQGIDFVKVDSQARVRTI